MCMYACPRVCMCLIISDFLNDRVFLFGENTKICRIKKIVSTVIHIEIRQ